jgi:hypothetical protein
VKHGAEEPHDAGSLYYQYRFYGLRGRWPTWADAVAHCTAQTQELWRMALSKHAAWTEPPEDVEPIADPVAESINQPVGDIQSHGFGPEGDV